MKLLHLSDLHLGIKLKAHNLIPIQTQILEDILSFVKKERMDGVIIAGDIYDSVNPPDAAVELFEHFLLRLSRLHTKVFVISGNHDDDAKLSFGSEFFKESDIFIAKSYKGSVSKYSLQDEYGPIHFYLLPYLTANTVRAMHPEEKNIKNCHDALTFVLKNINLNKEERNVLIAHQFVGNALQSDSETVYLGGSEIVEPSLFSDFDYVALGHIHTAQHIWRDHIRYCGTMFSYSISEAKRKKQLLTVELKEKGTLLFTKTDIVPPKNIVEISGSLETVLSPAFRENLNSEDFYYVELVEDRILPEAMSDLKKVFPYILQLNYKTEKSANQSAFLEQNMPSLKPADVFEQLFMQMQGRGFSEKEKQIVHEILEEMEQ